MKNNSSFDKNESFWDERYRSVVQNPNAIFDIETFEDLIWHYNEVGLPEKVVRICNLAITKFPFTADFKVHKARVYYNRGRFQNALKLLEEAEKYQPNDNELRLLKASALLQSGKVKQAEEIFESVQSTSFELDEVYVTIAQAYQAIHKYSKAFEYYRSALLSRKNEETVLNELINCIEISGDFKSGVKLLEEYLDVNPFSSLAWLELGTIFNKTGNLQRAVEACGFAHALNSDNPDALEELSLAYLNLEDYEEALKGFVQLKKNGTQKPDLFFHMGLCYQGLEKYEKAISHLRNAVKLDPHFIEAFHELGKAYTSIGRYIDAIRYIKKALEFDGLNEELWLDLARAEYQLGNELSALEAFEKAANLDPSSPDVYLEWSIIYYEQARFDFALRILRLGLAELPTEAALHYRACAYLMAIGNFSQLMVHMKHALELDYEGHKQLFDFFPDIESQKIIFKIIERIEKNRVR